MSYLMFFYTLAILLICVVTAVLSLAAYASSRQKLFIYGSGTFACYALEMTEIFFFEYTLQNQSYPVADYYDITMPILRTVIATAAQAFIWLVALDILDKHSKKLFVYPIVCFTLAELIILNLMPVSPLRQWLYYTTRSVFLFFIGGYIHYTSRKADERFRTRLNKFKKYLNIAVFLVVCIVIEDFYNILVVPVTLTPDWLQLYLSERNFSENIFAVYFAVLLIGHAFNVLSIRMKEAPVQTEANDLDRHVDEQMPFFRETYKLSNRETEVLRLVVLGKSNSEIAEELYLAVGTIKTHVHNILVKTNQKSREALVTKFWQG